MGGSTQVRGTVGTGTDIVSVARIAALYRTAGDRFLRRWFTDDEIDYCTSRARPELHLAARMAAKEAVLKALAPGRRRPPRVALDRDRPRRRRRAQRAPRR